MIIMSQSSTCQYLPVCGQVKETAWVITLYIHACYFINICIVYVLVINTQSPVTLRDSYTVEASVNRIDIFD